MHQLLKLLALAFALAALAGCATNPFVQAHTGPRETKLTKDAPVEVLGFDLGDPQQRDAFDAALERTRQAATPLGSASFISSATLRDQAVAHAARQLGANRALYTFAYRNSSTEYDTQPGYAFPSTTGRVHASSDPGDTFLIISGPTVTTTTKHWWLYRAWFFQD